MMRFGMPILLEHASVEESAALCRKLGLEFVELNMNLPQYQTGAMDAALLGDVAQKYGIFYTLHLDDNMNVADFNPAVAKAYEDTVLEAIGLAKELGVPVINMHLSRGVVFTLPEKKVYLFDEYREAYLHRMAEFRDRCRRAIGDSGIRICVENTSGYPQWQLAAVDCLLESSAFGLTFDVGHDHCAGAGDKAAILERKERLRHIHLHDAIRPKQDHLALGAGELDVKEILELARAQDCTVVLETKTKAGLCQSVAWLERNWRQA